MLSLFRFNGIGLSTVNEFMIQERMR